MRAKLLLSLIKKYSKCPACGSPKVKSVKANDKEFIRECHCGFIVDRKIEVRNAK